ncbi:MAG: hypothetical protein ABEN55_20515, partial [Bradymonadaceae bacterium]
MSARASAIPVFAIGCLLLVASPLRAQTTRVATDGIQLPDRSVTTQSNAASVEVNPAGVGVQWIDRPLLGADAINYQKCSFALALRPGDNVSIGGGVHFYGTAADRRLNDLTSVDLGAQWRPSRYFGVGVALQEDTNHPFLRPEQGLPVRIRPGAALRLIDGRIILDNQLTWVPGDDRLAYSPRIDVRPLEGLEVFARATFPFTSTFE